MERKGKERDGGERKGKRRKGKGKGWKGKEREEKEREGKGWKERIGRLFSPLIEQPSLLCKEKGEGIFHNFLPFYDEENVRLHLTRLGNKYEIKQRHEINKNIKLCKGARNT